MKVEVGGVTLHYEVSGHGPNLVLSHGVIESSKSWLDVIPLLSEHFRVITYDARGRGRSGGHQTPFGYADLASDLESLAGDLDLDRFFHAGHSMGGRIVLEHALAHPERVAGIAVISARAEAPDDTGRARLRALIGSVETNGPGAGVDLWVEPTDSHYSRARSISGDNSLEGTRQALETLVNMGPFTTQLSAIAVPTLIMAGDHDKNYLESARLMARQIPNASLRILTGVGHFPNLECPALLAKGLTEYFTAIDSAATRQAPLPSMKTPPPAPEQDPRGQ